MAGADRRDGRAQVKQPRKGAAAAILDFGGPTPTGEGDLRPSALEETGVAVRIEHLIGIYRLENGFTATLFRCSIAEGEPALQVSGEIDEVGWFAPDEIPQPRSNLLHHALDDIVGGRRGVVRDGLPRIN